MFTGVSHIYYRVRDVEESIDFYTKNLGFTLLRKYMTSGRLSAYVELDGVLLEFGVPADLSELPGERTIRRIGIAVDDMDAALADLTSKGRGGGEGAVGCNDLLGSAGGNPGPIRVRGFPARVERSRWTFLRGVDTPPRAS